MLPEKKRARQTMNIGQSLISKVKKNFKKANAKSAEFTQIERIKISMLGVKKETEEKLIELGGQIYEKFKKGEDSNLMQNLPIRHLTEQIKELENELEKHKSALEQIKKKI